MPEKRKTPLLPLIVAVVAALALGLVLLQGGDDEADAPGAAAPSAASTAPPESWLGVALIALVVAWRRRGAVDEPSEPQRADTH